MFVKLNIYEISQMYRNTWMVNLDLILSEILYVRQFQVFSRKTKLYYTELLSNFF